MYFSNTSRGMSAAAAPGVARCCAIGAVAAAVTNRASPRIQRRVYRVFMIILVNETWDGDLKTVPNTTYLY